MIHCTSRARAIGEDALLVALPVAVLALGFGSRAPGSAPSPWLWLLAGACAAVLAFNAITLHFPRKIIVSEEGIRFRAYGREHRYAWRASRVRVRRFLVRDRVLVRVEDLGTGKSRRYWLTTQLSDYDALVRELTARSP